MNGEICCTSKEQSPITSHLPLPLLRLLRLLRLLFLLSVLRLLPLLTRIPNEMSIQLGSSSKRRSGEYMT